MSNIISRLSMENSNKSIMENNSNQNNDNDVDHVEIELSEFNDTQIREPMLEAEIRHIDNHDQQSYCKLVGKFVFNVTFITIMLLIYVAIGVILGLIFSAFKFSHDIL